MPNICIPWTKRKTAQSSIPFEKMYDDGICSLGNGQYSATWRFEDINYQKTDESSQQVIIEKYCHFLNSFDETERFQIHISTKKLTQAHISLAIPVPDNASEDLKQCIRESNEMKRKQFFESDAYIQEKYITVTIKDGSYDAARRRFMRIDSDKFALLRKIAPTVKMLDKIQRLSLLREIYRPDDTSEISYKEMARTGIYDKDIIAPYSIDTSHDDYIKLGSRYTQTLFLYDFPHQMYDRFVYDLTTLNSRILLTINAVPQNPRLAIKEVGKRLRQLDCEKENDRSRQVKQGIAFPEPPRDLSKAIESAEEVYRDLQARNEKMFLFNALIFISAESPAELDAAVDKIQDVVAQDGCAVKPFTFAQEDGLNSVVPLGRNDTFVRQTMMTSSIAGFIPFNVVEVVHPEGLFYGKNKLSNNVILLNRKRFENPHEFLFGGSGSGKSVAAKLEIWECFFRTNDDMIIIDPEGEFTKLVRLLGGQIIEISNSSKTRFNPFDINEFYGGDDEPDPVRFKSDFIISLIEVTMGNRDGLDLSMKSIIDRCVRGVYQKYKQHPCEENIPTFMDFYNLLKQQKEPAAKYLTSALEIYTEGSLNIFASKSNVNINNRLICFNTRNLGKQLTVMAMTVIQDFCWNRISKNQAENKNTWLWNDEIHHSLKSPSTADWLSNCWKRGRKYGLVATGMTQEVHDVLRNDEAKSLISNSEFIMLFRQKNSMIADLSQVVDLSDDQIDTLLTCDQGTGLFKIGNGIVEFDNRIDTNTKLFDIVKTDVGEKAAQKDSRKAG
ncbi:MAG: ATP-binding protein [Oscillospiraceae bacterium]|nr:ATP-binding protein [Oscillospiraceae bacterium]